MSDISTTTLLGILLLLVLLSAFFSGSETALMTLNRYRLQHMARQGHPGALRAQRLLKRPDRLIGLILLGNNFANILASSLATIIAIRVGGEAAIAAAAGILTLVILLFAEVTPKTLAALHPERLAYPAAFVYGPLLKLLYPLVWFVNGIAIWLLRLIGVSPDDLEGQALSQEELRSVLMEAGAMIPKKRQNMLLNILDLEKAQVEDIMVPRNEVDGIDLKESLDEILQKLHNSPYTLIPVFDDGIDHIIGILHIRKAMHALARGELTRETIREIADTPYYIPEGTSLSRQLINFQRRRKRVGLVVDEYGDVLGLVTLADLLEEIVGEFTSDPSDSEVDIQPQSDGSYLVAGSANIRDLVKSLGLKLPVDGPRTINGLIIEYLETIPEPGTSLLLEGYPIEILQTQDNAIKVVRIDPHRRTPRPRVLSPP